MVENVLLVTIDSLRYDDFLDWTDGPLPGIDDATSFTRAYAAGPATSPSFPALLTGTLPLSHGGLGPLSADRPSLAATMSAAGYDTGAFHCNPFLSSSFGYDRGFDTFRDYQNPLMGLATRLFPRGIERGDGHLQRLDAVVSVTDLLKRAYRTVSGRPRPYVRAEVITDDALDWLADADDPFFGWVHYMDVHQPCHPPHEYRARHGVGDISHDDVSAWYETFVRRPEELTDDVVADLRSLVAAGFEYTFEQVDRLLDTLAATDRLEETLIVLTSDHGELYGEHGQFGKPARLYDELLHVPLVTLNEPDSAAAARKDLVSLLDVPPLVVDGVGHDVPDEFQGRVPGADPREHLLAEHEVEGDVVVGARSRSALYEVDERRDERRFSVATDGNLEPVDLTAVDDHPDGDHLRAAVSERLDALSVSGYDWTGHVDDDVQERLKDLGYR